MAKVGKLDTEEAVGPTFEEKRFWEVGDPISLEELELLPDGGQEGEEAALARNPTLRVLFRAEEEGWSSGIAGVRWCSKELPLRSD